MATENPQVIEGRPLPPEKGNVWSVIWFEVVIGPYFLENDDGTTVNVNSEHMITAFFCLLLRNTTWGTCGFIKTVPHVIQLERI